MIINIDAFKKAENIINQEQDRLNGETAMKFIRDTNPIVIIDEPQSVDNTPKAKRLFLHLIRFVFYVILLHIVKKSICFID